MCVNFWTVGNDWIHRRRLVPEKTQYRWAEHSFIFRFWIFDRADSDGVAEYILGESWSTRETSQWRRFLHLNLIFFEELIIQTKTMIRRPSMNHSNSAGASISFNTRSSAYRIRLSSLTRCWTCAKKNLHSHSIRWLTFRPMHSTTTHNDSYTQYYYYFFFLPVVLQWMGLWRLWAFIASNAACCSHSIIKAIYRCLIWFSTCNLIFIIYFFSLCVACRAYMCAVWLCVGSFDLLVSLILLSVVFFFTTVTRQNAKACYRVESSYFIHRMYARGCVAHVYSRRMKQCRIHSWPATVSSIPIRLRWIMRGGGHSSASKHSSNESEYNKPPRISYIILY